MSVKMIEFEHGEHVVEGYEKDGKLMLCVDGLMSATDADPRVRCSLSAMLGAFAALSDVIEMLESDTGTKRFCSRTVLGAYLTDQENEAGYHAGTAEALEILRRVYALRAMDKAFAAIDAGRPVLTDV